MVFTAATFISRSYAVVDLGYDIYIYTAPKGCSNLLTTFDPLLRIVTKINRGMESWLETLDFGPPYINGRPKSRCHSRTPFLYHPLFDHPFRPSSSPVTLPTYKFSKLPISFNPLSNFASLPRYIIRFFFLLFSQLSR